MASVGRGSDDGKGRMREEMIQRGGNPTKEIRVNGEKTSCANHCKENDGR